MTDPARIVVLISGSGSNLQALIYASKNGPLAQKGEIVGVISNRRDAYGLVRASQAVIPTVYFPFGRYRQQGRAAYDLALADITAALQPDLIVLAGWMRILTAGFLDRFSQKLLRVRLTSDLVHKPSVSHYPLN